jgi:hypothetical protein
MGQCSCGKKVSALSTSCPKCGKAFLGKTAVFILGFIVLLGALMLTCAQLGS